MAFRIRKSVKLLPGVRVNLSKSGVSVSAGGRGAVVNVSSRGVRQSIGIPGTGLSWSKAKGWQGKASRPSDEISALMSEAGKMVTKVEKCAERGNAIVARINRGIDTLNGGRGVTASKAGTFQKRSDAELKKLASLHEEMEEISSFYQAVQNRLRKIKFGFFSGKLREIRDNGINAVEAAKTSANDVLLDFDKLEEMILETRQSIADEVS